MLEKYKKQFFSGLHYIADIFSFTIAIIGFIVDIFNSMVYIVRE